MKAFRSDVTCYLCLKVFAATAAALCSIQNIKAKRKFVKLWLEV